MEKLGLVHVSLVAKLTLGDDCALRGDCNDRTAIFDHAIWPVALSFRQGSFGKERERVYCRALPCKETYELATLAGWRHPHLYDHSASDYKARHHFERSIHVSRFSKNPEKVARELSAHIIEPAKPAAFKALAYWSEKAAQEIDAKKAVDQICARFDMVCHQRSPGGNFEISKRNCKTLSSVTISSSHGAKIVMDIPTEKLQRFFEILEKSQFL